MSYDNAIDILYQIGEAKGKAKELLLSDNSENRYLRKILTYAYDPQYMFGIKSLNINNVSTGTEFLDERCFALLDELVDKILTGNKAIEKVKNLIASLHPIHAEVFLNILQKDLRLNIGCKTINKAIPGLLFSFDCMLAKEYNSKRIKSWPVFVQPKLDGVRVLAIVSGQEARFYSRKGKEFTVFEHIATQLLDLWWDLPFAETLVFDGEVVSGQFNKTVSDVRKKSEQMTDGIFTIFNVLTIDEFKEGRSKASFMNMRLGREAKVKDYLLNYLNIEYIKTELAYYPEEIDQMFREVYEMGGEGVVVKIPGDRYVAKRSYSWMKIKAELSIDAPIIGAFEGTGKYQGVLGGIVVDVDGINVRVGSGFTDDQRKSFWDAYQDGVLVDRLVEVGYHEKTPDGSLRHPRFKRFREDKEFVWH